MKTIGLNRMRFSLAPNSEPQVSIDAQLQDFLQTIENKGSSVVSVQQTHVEYVQKNSPDTYIIWAEFLIFSRVISPYLP